jgi:DNA-binding CsgD family transcriptional regulator
MKGKARSLDLLNEREQEIVQRLASGLSDQQIADELFLSLHTVKWYNRQICSKLGVKSRTQAIACVKNLGWLESRDSPLPQTDSWMGVCWLLLISSKKHTNLPLQLPGHLTPESQEMEKILALAARNSCAGKHPSASLVPWSAKNDEKLHSDEHTEARCGFCVSSLQLFGRTYALRR